MHQPRQALPSRWVCGKGAWHRRGRAGNRGAISVSARGERTGCCGIAAFQPFLGNGGAMGRITNLDALEKWLQGRDLEIAAAIATRAVLRALPMVSGNWDNLILSDERTIVLMPALRAAIVAKVLVSNRDDQVARAARSAADSVKSVGHVATNTVIENVIEALAYLARGSAREFNLLTAFAKQTPNQIWENSDDFSDLVYAIDCAVQTVAYNEDVKVFWDSTKEDCLTFDNGKAPGAVVSLPLWFGSEIPKNISRAWQRIDAFFARDTATWSFWRDWYQRVLDGAHQNQKLLYDIALIPNEDWEEGP